MQTTTADCPHGLRNVNAHRVGGIIHFRDRGKQHYYWHRFVFNVLLHPFLEPLPSFYLRANAESLSPCSSSTDGREWHLEYDARLPFRLSSLTLFTL